MPRKSTRKKSAADLLVTPASDPTPKQSGKKSVKSPTTTGFEFDFSKFISTPDLNNSPPSKKKPKNAAGVKTLTPTAPKVKNLGSVSDLKDFAASQMDSIKRHLDRSHGEIVKDVEASESRLNKRLKLQTQGCQQVMDEAEKEYKKMSDRIGEGREAMKASYSEFITELQASSSRVFKSSLPELSQSFGKAIDSLKSRYGIV